MQKTARLTMTYTIKVFCHVTGAGEEYDLKQKATAEFIDNNYEHVLNNTLLYSKLNIQSRDKIL